MDELLRKIVVSTEDLLIEGNRKVPKLCRVTVAAGVIANPWAGRGFVADLTPEIHELAPKLGAVLVPRLIEAIGGSERVEAYGKAAVVGLNGEVEHGSAFIHTLRFGNLLRVAVGGTSYVPFTNKRAAAGCWMDIPLKHTKEDGRRSHFLTATIAVADAPGPDEIVVAIAAATSGRPHARIGDRYEDMKEMGVDQTGKVATPG